VGNLNSKVLGRVANAYGDNSVYPSQLLSNVMGITVDGDRYRRRFRVANASELVGDPDQTRRYKFKPGETISWLVHAGDVLNDQATKDINLNVLLIDPANAIGTVVWSAINNLVPGRTSFIAPMNDNSGTQDGYAGGRLFVPAGYELDILITAVAAPFEPAAFLTSLYLEEVPKQEDISKLVASEVITT